MEEICQYCQLTTAGEHEFNCPEREERVSDKLKEFAEGMTSVIIALNEEHIQPYIEKRLREVVLAEKERCERLARGRKIIPILRFDKKNDGRYDTWDEACEEIAQVIGGNENE